MRDHFLCDPVRSSRVCELGSPVLQDAARNVLEELRVRELVAVPLLAVLAEVCVPFSLSQTDEERHVGIIVFLQDIAVGGR